MSKTKAIEGKIKSLENITKITKAMQLIAASRLHKTKQAIRVANEYEQKLRSIENEFINNPLLLELKAKHSYCAVRKAKKSNSLLNAHVYLLTSEKGLCGSFNVGLARECQKQVEFLIKERRKVTIHFCGRKGKEAFGEGRFSANNVLTGEHFADVMLKLIPYGDVKDIVQKIKQHFESGDADEVYFCYSDFKSVINSELKLERVLPLTFDNENESDYYGATNNKSKSIPMLWNENFSSTTEAMRNYKSKSNAIVEPNLPLVVDSLLKQFLDFRCYSFFLNSMTSEHASRMFAMDNATKNGKELIETNRLLRNKIRQTAITTELTEIVAGLEG